MDEIPKKKFIKHGGVFPRTARAIANATGRPTTFLAAVLIVVIWGASGRYFGYSDTWQLVINTSTTIVTFLMVFLIQNTQNRDSQAVQLKLDELIRSKEGAHTALIDLEELTDRELEVIRRKYLELARRGREKLRSGESDTGSPEVEP